MVCPGRILRMGVSGGTAGPVVVMVDAVDVRQVSVSEKHRAVTTFQPPIAVDEGALIDIKGAEAVTLLMEVFS